MHKKKCFIILRGGLGNQLFQLASSIKFLENHEIIAWTGTGFPRKTNHKTDIEHFMIPIPIKFKKGPKLKLINKLFAMNLSFGLKLKLSIADKITNLIVIILIKITLLFRVGMNTTLITGKGVGFFELKDTSKSVFLNGYFQSEKWVADKKVSNILNQMQPKVLTSNFNFWRTLIQKENPIILHIRLKDYREEPEIGILSKNYFLQALSLLEEKNIKSKVWIFTDEPCSVDAQLTVPSNFEVKIFSDLSLTPAETLQLMRHGSAFIISNSTFSWWSAYLRHNKDSKVIMPYPWFKNLPSPNGIAPIDWIKINDPF